MGHLPAGIFEVSKVKGEYPADTFLPPFEDKLAHASLKERFEGFDLYLYE